MGDKSLFGTYNLERFSEFLTYKIGELSKFSANYPFRSTDRKFASVT